MKIIHNAILLILFLGIIVVSCNNESNDDDDNDSVEEDDDNDDSADDDSTDDDSVDDDDIDYPPMYNVLGEFQASGDVIWSRTVKNASSITSMAEIPTNEIVITEYEDNTFYYYDYNGELTAQKDIFDENQILVTIEELALSSTNIYFIDNGYKVQNDGYVCQLNKTDFDGNLTWTKDISTNYPKKDLYNLIIDSQDDLLVAGYTGYAEFGYLFIQKYSQAGTLQWTWIVEAEDNLIQTPGLATDSDDNIYVTGQSVNEGCFIGKINSTGQTIWEREYYPSGISSSTSSGYKVIIDEDRYIYVAAECGWEESCLLKYDRDGNLIWDIVRESEEHEFNMFTERFLSFDPEGDLIYAAADGNDVVSTKFDRNGNLQWEARYESAAPELILGDMVVDKYGNIYLAGNACENVAPNGDGICVSKYYYLIKYKSDGELQWIYLKGADEQESKDDGKTKLDDTLIVAFSLNGKDTRIALGSSLRMENLDN